MFSNVFKVVLSLSLLAAVSASAGEIVDHSRDAVDQQSQDARQGDASKGITQENTRDKSTDQSKKLKDVDANSPAAIAAARAAAARGAQPAATDISLFKGEIRTYGESNADFTTVISAQFRGPIVKVVYDVGKKSVAKGRSALAMLKNAVSELKGKGIDAEGQQEASEVILSLEETALSDAGDTDSIINANSGQEAVKMYVEDVELGSPEFHKLSLDAKKKLFKAAENFKLIQAKYREIRTVQKSIELAKGTPKKDISNAIMAEAAYQVIKQFHPGAEGAVDFMSEADMRQLAHEIVFERHCA